MNEKWYRNLLGLIGSSIAFTGLCFSDNQSLLVMGLLSLVIMLFVFLFNILSFERK